MLTASVSPAAHLLPRLLLLLGYGDHRDVEHRLLLLLGDGDHRDFGHRLLFLLLGDGDHCDVVVMLSFLTGAVIPSSSSHHIAHLSLPRSIGCVALSFLVRLVVWLSRYGNTRPNLTSSWPTPPNPYIF